MNQTKTLLDLIPQVSTIGHEVRYDCEVADADGFRIVQRTSGVVKARQVQGYIVATILGPRDINGLDGTDLRVSEALKLAVEMVAHKGEAVVDGIVVHPQHLADMNSEDLPPNVPNVSVIECNALLPTEALVGAFGLHSVLRPHESEGRLGAMDEGHIAFYVRRPAAFVLIDNFAVRG